MAVTVVLIPVLQKAEKCRFYQEIRGCYKGTIILKNSVPIRSIPFKCIFVRLEKALMREKKMNAKFHWHYIYIRLEYSITFVPFSASRSFAVQMIDRHSNPLSVGVVIFILISLLNAAEAFYRKVYESERCANLQPVTLQHYLHYYPVNKKYL